MNEEISEEERQAIIARNAAHYQAIHEANLKRPPPTREESDETWRLRAIADAQTPPHLRTELMQPIVKK